MLFRCRWCERAFCEDCLDWDKTDILSENLKEYELLGFPPVDQAFYIKCPRCIEDHEASPGDLALCNNAQKEIDEKHKQMIEERAAVDDEAKRIIAIPSRDESLTDATTINSSGITTPGLNGVEQASTLPGKRARRSAQKSFAGSLGSTSSNARENDSTLPDRHRRQAAPKSFASSFDLTSMDFDDSDRSTASASRKRGVDLNSSGAPPKRLKRLTA